MLLMIVMIMKMLMRMMLDMLTVMVLPMLLMMHEYSHACNDYVTCLWPVATLAL